MSEETEYDATILWLVWGALLFSMLIYVIVPVAIPPPPGHEPIEIAAGNPPKIAVILGIAAVVLIPLLYRMRDRMFYEPLGEECYPGTSEARAAYFTMSMTTWVMCEVVGVFGFAVYFLTYELLFSVPFAVLGMLLLLLFRPDPDAAEQTELGAEDVEQRND
ncbi:MAG: hypothetical protein ACQEVA_19750 [Myxococcota bacterium]